MENAKSPNEINEELKLDQARVGRIGDMRFQGCSAKTGEGIWEGIGQLSDAIEIQEKK